MAFTSSYTDRLIGSILNNSFTNLTPFGPGSFTNEIVGGGTLFETDKLS